MLALGAFGVGAATALVFILAAVLIYLLAKANIFFTIVYEGQAKAIKLLGKFHRVVMSYKGHRLTTEWDVCGPEQLGKIDPSGKFIQTGVGEEPEVGRVTRWTPIPDEPGKFKRDYVCPKLVPEPWCVRANIPLISKRIGGLRWVGIPPIYSVHRYDFRWASFRQSASQVLETPKEDIEATGELKEIVEARKKNVDYILLQDDAYYTAVEGAETQGMVPLNIALLLTVRIVNPYKALFVAEEWLELAVNRTKPAVRQFVATKQYEELIKLVNASREWQTDEFLTHSQLSAYLERTYGVRLKEVGFVAIEPSGKRAEKYFEAASKEWEATKEVQRLDNVYKTIIDKYGDRGLAIRFMETIEAASGKQGNWIIPIGPLHSLVESITGKHPAETK